MNAILDTEIAGIVVSVWLSALAIGLGGVIVALVVRWVAAGIVRRTSARRAESEMPPGDIEPGDHADGRARGGAWFLFALRMIESFVFPALVLGGFYIAVTTLGLEGQVGAVVSVVFFVLFSLVAIRFLVTVVNELFRHAAEQRERVDLTRIRPLHAIAVFAVWIAGLLFLLDNLGFDITAVIAGLGIGGIAVALAAQAMLGDLFSYFVILFDKPFELGDFLVFDDVLGSVERIGVKTTRLRSLGGELIVVSNSDLTSSRVRNYEHMQRRRVVFKVGVVYGTEPESVRAIPGIIESIIRSEELAAFDRAHFASYGDCSLVFEVVYYVASPDYNLYMDVQERINLAIYEAFAERGIEFAFPTQTLHLVHRHEASPPQDEHGT
ncbi:MAG: mechanosensitive ion channel family protein [Spirochaetota bacterium]